MCEINKQQGYTVQHREIYHCAIVTLNGVESRKILNHYVIYLKLILQINYNLIKKILRTQFFVLFLKSPLSNKRSRCMQLSNKRLITWSYKRNQFTYFSLKWDQQSWVVSIFKPFWTIVHTSRYLAVLGQSNFRQVHREHYKKGVNVPEHTGRLRPRFGAFSQKAPFTVNPKALLIL